MKQSLFLGADLINGDITKGSVITADNDRLKEHTRCLSARTRERWKADARLEAIRQYALKHYESLKLLPADQERLEVQFARLFNAQPERNPFLRRADVVVRLQQIADEIDGQSPRFTVQELNVDYTILSHVERVWELIAANCSVVMDTGIPGLPTISIPGTCYEWDVPETRSFAEWLRWPGNERPVIQAVGLAWEKMVAFTSVVAQENGRKDGRAKGRHDALCRLGNQEPEAHTLEEDSRSLRERLQHIYYRSYKAGYADGWEDGTTRRRIPDRDAASLRRRSAQQIRRPAIPPHLIKRSHTFSFGNAQKDDS